MPFKLDLVQRSLQPGACVAQLARQNGINDNLLFTWRQRYRHLVDVPSDTIPAPAIISDDIQRPGFPFFIRYHRIHPALRPQIFDSVR